MHGQQLLQEIEILPPELQKQVSDFVIFLRKQQQKQHIKKRTKKTSAVRDAFKFFFAVFSKDSIGEIVVFIDDYINFVFLVLAVR